MHLHQNLKKVLFFNFLFVVARGMSKLRATRIVSGGLWLFSLAREVCLEV